MSLKLKDFIIPFILAFCATALVQYFFRSDKTKDHVDLESGRAHEAPRVREIHRPLNLEIDFIDTRPNIVAEKTALETDYAKMVFSSEGAAIEQIEYKHLVNSKDTLLPVLNAKGKEDRTLLIAFDEKTPFYYKLLSKDENEENYTLNYQAEFDKGTINKKFTVFKHESKIDLEIEINPSSTLDKPIMPRILYASPLLNEIQDDVIQAILNEGKNIIKKNASALLQRYWEIPSMFGLEDRYFVHAMIKDENGFAQRGYYKTQDLNVFMSILEGPSVKEKSKWKLSFYFGQKKMRNIAAVDPRLEASLDYGYLGILSKPLLSVLNFFYRLFGSYGLAIILLTFLIKLLLLPFTLKGEQSMKSRMEFQRKLQYIQQKYKDDKQALALARAELFKKHGLGDMSGCLPLLMQIPIFFALNRVLSTAIELYRAPFLWIPNLSAKDPYYILPLLVGVSLLMHSTSTDPRQKFSGYAMALLVGVFTASLPAGLTLFIFVSTILTVLQTKIYTYFKKA